MPLTERRNQARGANEWADTFGSIGAAASMQLTQLPLNILDLWQDETGSRQPFKPYPPDKLQELAENIRKNGVIEAICVRPTGNGRFQIIAGHNRVAAAKLAGLATIPAVVRQMDDDEAALRLVDSNLQHRETLLPSEKAFAYKMRLDAMKRQGKRTDLTSSPMGTKLRSDEELAEAAGESRNQIQRYIRLTYLIPALLDMVDRKQFGFRPAVEISYLSPEEQELLYQVLVEHGLKPPNLRTANALRRWGKPLSEETICVLLLPPDEEKKENVKISANRLRDFFPPSTPADTMEQIILDALAAYMGREKENDV